MSTLQKTLGETIRANLQWRDSPYRVPEIVGLQYVPNYLPAESQAALLAQIEQGLWLTDLRRRVQHYGFRYDYRGHRLSPEAYLGPLPRWLETLAQQLQTEGYVRECPDQAIINEYQAGQGIAAHIDCVPCFDDTILSLSLGSACVMEFSNVATKQIIPLVLDPGCLIVMQAEARYDWKHGIPARKSDLVAGRVLQRGRRLSITLRKTILI